MVRVVERRLDGRSPLDVAGGVLEPADPLNWSARVASFRADGVSVELVRAGPFRYSGTTPTGPGGALVLLAVGAGRLHGVSDAGAFEVTAGHSLLADATDGVILWAEEDVQLLRVAVDRSEVPVHLLARTPTPLTVLAPSPVLQASVAFASTVLRSSRAEQADGGDDERTVARSMIALHVGLLEESNRQRVHRTGDADRRSLIEAHIETHLDDPDLSPTSIAQHFGLSLRSVHAAFVDADSTVAATIRSRRVEAVKRTLLASGPMPLLGELAATHGFHDRTHLSRSFRSVTGCVPRAWWEAARRQRG